MTTAIHKHNGYNGMETTVGMIGFIVAMNLVVIGAMDADTVLDDRYTAYCFLGSAIGSAVYIARNKIYDRDDMIWIFLGNLGIAYIASPFLCDQIITRNNIAMSFRVCLFISGLIAWLISWILINFLPALWDKLRQLASYFNLG